MTAALLLSLALACPPPRAHPGGVDASGCHADRRSGKAHCHDEKAKRGVEELSGKVVGVSDGDTVTVLVDGRGVKVRLFGVDCPEKRQAFGSRAKQFTSELVYGRRVTVRVQDKDRYERLVGEVFLEDGRVLNRELVREGLAWWYRQYAPDDAELSRLEDEARAAKKGLWSDPAGPVAPWSFRRKQAGRPGV